MVALAKLARDYGKGPVQIREISEKENIPRSFLENILLELRKMGILQSTWKNREDIFITETR